MQLQSISYIATATILMNLFILASIEKFIILHEHFYNETRKRANNSFNIKNQTSLLEEP